MNHNREHLHTHLHPRKRSAIFFILVVVFGLIAVLITTGILLTALMFDRMRPMMHDHMMTNPLSGFIPFLVGLSLLGIMAAILIRLAKRRFSNPLGKIMDAADAITRGDLSTRVEENEHSPFHNMEIAFNRMVTELERSDQRRRSQTADIAHELNTPIHIIRGYLEGILDGIYQPDTEIINSLLDETQLLSRLVEDLRTLSLADAGALPLHPETINLSEILKDLQVTFLPQMESASVALEITAPDTLAITADPSYLYRILNNLLSNALRHTPAGGRIQVTANHVDNGTVISVTDTGEGIRPEDLPFIFDRFWQKEKSRNHADGSGHGLGLSIVQQLVQAHAGNINVTSIAGEGATFTIFLPTN